ncbi:MATE family efflux transporter [Treponema brennaborense]|uniref:Multidrug-efflux transporter n=1 Tax=Treponema brennaborense (strain DSM 12168 / CIP 105900 / DD5/3) TaxID=906968 RepID=F4LNK6_TREBD|nr:MATE family efflux transporter [Treponema brennaborense]AEE15860.1 MATE efflux family protein [Treponema brennaborense DSM 12168]
MFRIDKTFYRTLVVIAVPIILQNLMQSFINMLDTIMVGQLGAVEIAAVGLGNQIFFMLNMILFGISSGGAIFIAQYWGKKDVAGIRRTLGIALSFASVVAALFTAAALAAPEFLIGLYSKDPAVVKAGGAYLRVVACSYPMMAVSFVYSQAFRSTEHVKLPMIATIASLVANGLLNYVFIFGAGPVPAMGVVGAAAATVISRALELAVLLVTAYRKKYEAAARPKELFSYGTAFVAKYVKIAFPVILNETFWGLGITVQNAIFARAGTDAIAAFNITGTISQLTWVFFIGVGNAAAIIIGKKIGASDRTEAYRYANKFAVFMPIMSVFIGIWLIPLSKALPLFFKVDPEIIMQAARMLLVMMCTYPFKSFNMCMIVGICRSGGDTVFAAICDILFMWTIALPLGAVAALVLHAEPWAVYICILSEEIFKSSAGFVRLKSKKWLHDVTV